MLGFTKGYMIMISRETDAMGEVCSHIQTHHSEYNYPIGSISIS